MKALNQNRFIIEILFWSIKGACSHPQPHPHPYFFQTYGDFGTNSWVIFRIEVFMCEVSCTKSVQFKKNRWEKPVSEIGKHSFNHFLKQYKITLTFFSLITFKRDTNLHFFHLGWCICLKSDHFCKFKENSFPKIQNRHLK